MWNIPFTPRTCGPNDVCEISPRVRLFIHSAVVCSSNVNALYLLGTVDGYGRRGWSPRGMVRNRFRRRQADGRRDIRPRKRLQSVRQERLPLGRRPTVLRHTEITRRPVRMGSGTLYVVVRSKSRCLMVL